MSRRPMKNIHQIEAEAQASGLRIPVKQTRLLLVRPNRLGIGHDVGWRVWDRNGVPVDLWWGNTRDRRSLEGLVADAASRGIKFLLSPEAKTLLAPDAGDPDDRPPGAAGG